MKLTVHVHPQNLTCITIHRCSITIIIIIIITTTIIIIIIVVVVVVVVGRDSSVGIATRYAVDGPGIESPRGGRDFMHPSRLALGPTQPPLQWVQGLSRGKAALAWR